MRQLALITIFMVAAGAVAAQEPAAPPASDASVARLSAIRGGVSTQRGAEGEWDTGALNQPLLTGDSIATSEGARGEVELDFADVLRLDGNAEATLANLTDSTIQVQVGQGTVDYVVLSGPTPTAAAEIDSPNLAVHPQGAGVFRIQVNSDTETLVTVRSGAAKISTPQGSVDLNQGQTITVEGSDDPQYQIADAAAPDAFDQWNDTRDRAIASAASWNNANHYYTGAADLDGYGHWMPVPGYGQVWAPNVAPGWAPYSVGSWVYEPAWGWTWVSSEPWGWTPYHYGRWFVYDAEWVWWPGPVMANPYYQPVWAPAYVSFVGLGPGVGVGFGGGYGAVGWVAIGPGDPFRPWWGVGIGVGFVEPLAPVGVVGYANLRLMYTSPMVARGLIAVPAGRFGGGVVVRAAVTPAEIRGGTVLSGRLPMVPTAASRRVGLPINDPARLPRAAMARPAHFFGTPAPGAARDAAMSRGAGFHSFSNAGAASRRGNVADNGRASSSPDRAQASSESKSSSGSKWNQFTNGRAGGRATPPPKPAIKSADKDDK